MILVFISGNSKHASKRYWSSFLDISNIPQMTWVLLSFGLSLSLSLALSLYFIYITYMYIFIYIYVSTMGPLSFASFGSLCAPERGTLGPQETKETEGSYKTGCLISSVHKALEPNTRWNTKNMYIYIYTYIYICIYMCELCAAKHRVLGLTWI